MHAKQSKASPHPLEAVLQALPTEARDCLCARWIELYGKPPPANFPRILLELGIAYRLQERVHGGLSPEVRRKLAECAEAAPTKAPELRPGTTLVRTWNAVSHSVSVLDKGFAYKGKTYGSLTQIARAITGTHQSGPNFFGLRAKRGVQRA